MTLQLPVSFCDEILVYRHHVDVRLLLMLSMDAPFKLDIHNRELLVLLLIPF